MSISIKIDINFINKDRIADMGYASPADGGHHLDLGSTPTAELAVSGVAVCYPQGHVVPTHQHCSGHLIYADQGLLRVEAETGQWLVPPTSAVWLRPQVPHRLVVPVALQAHGIFVREDVCANLPLTDCVMQVSGLARELIVKLTSLDAAAPFSRHAYLLGELLIEELRATPPRPFHLPWPEHPQIRDVCQRLTDDPGHIGTTEDWANRLAISAKTFQRRFLKSTGMTFGRWRQQLRLMSSLSLLIQGTPITQVALASGYDSHSAYTTAFRRQFGQSPSAFLSSSAQAK
ncbi:MAG: helix-turn-helix transcriptional regulator [Halopseudomonas sp.]|uniref:AraC family transcriptional regulator n=1 Tax=Halopseudomonas sp. TaxID=2901191 RepID=UPI00300229CB